jgi:Kef-type K+ transport system membrane component KefB
MQTLPHEVAYLLLIFALMVVPRALQKFRIPGALTSFGLGLLTMAFIEVPPSLDTLVLFAALGISSLFLFAGLEIEIGDLLWDRWRLLLHLAVRSTAVAGVAYLAMLGFGVDWRAGTLLALAILTPSTGFILDSLPELGLDENERQSVRIKAVTGELFALAVLFVVLQAGAVSTLVLSSIALVALAAVIPLMFMLLGRYVLPYARGSEFSLLVMVGVVAAFATYQLGVYYLVGAFMAGFAARLLRDDLPRLVSEPNLHAIQMFASFFVPFYFFQKGLSVPGGALTLKALMLGALLTVVAMPLRIGLVWLQRRFLKGESPLASLRVAAALTPTLIFTLVLAEILRERFGISEVLYGALLVYAGATTLLPSLLLAKPIDLDVHLAFETPRDAGAEPPSRT